MKCNFSLKHYKESLRKAKLINYKFGKLSEYKKYKGRNMIIFMRHDVDFNLRAALEMAEIENKLGVFTTYFLRLHGPYNLFSLDNYRIVKEILKMNHEIGLHYEGDFAVLNKESVINMVKRDKLVLGVLINKRVLGCSAHEPIRSKRLLTVNNIKDLGFLYDAYSKRLLKENKYISDSSCRWREGCLCEFIKKREKRLYVLTHPIWWYKESPIENY